MIIYFTGTGNSKYLAEQIADQRNDTIIDAAIHIKQGKTPSFFSEVPYVFVAPTYAWRLPRIFEEWIRKCRFEGSSQAYFILNCGSSIGAAGKYAETLCTDLHFTYMGMAEILMPENYIAMFSAPDKETETQIIARAAKQNENLIKTIAAEQPLDKKPVSVIGQFCSGIVNDCFYQHIISAKKFYVTDTCISCGKCAEHCMLNNITLENGNPVWGDRCTHCMACICKCPTEAIEYGRHSRGLRRYTCPE